VLLKQRTERSRRSVFKYFFYGKRILFLKFIFKTPQTYVKDEILIGYPSIAAISDNLEELSINATLKKSSLGFKDILLFCS
jgi:hypothetical protein